MPFVPVARLDDIPTDRGLRVVVRPSANSDEGEDARKGEGEDGGGIAVGLYRVGGEVFAMEDVCPHAGFPLSLGHFEKCVVVCDAHGWPFDVRTGFDPDNADGFPIPCFAVRLVGDRVEVDLDVRTNDRRRKHRAPDDLEGDSSTGHD